MEEFKTLLIFRGLLRVINELVMDVEKEGINIDRAISSAISRTALVPLSVSACQFLVDPLLLIYPQIMPPLSEPIILL